MSSDVPKKLLPEKRKKYLVYYSSITLTFHFPKKPAPVV